MLQTTTSEFLCATQSRKIHKVTGHRKRHKVKKVLYRLNIKSLLVYEHSRFVMSSEIYFPFNTTAEINPYQ